MAMGNGNGGQFGETTLTKVFVGGLAWETQKEAIREHFERYGEILEAVIISDKVTGKSKGYGFVTFKEAEAAKKAYEDPSPMINGRQANCNLASTGARRPRSSSAAPKPGSTVGSRPVSSATQNPVQWYYAAGTPPYHHHPGIPFHYGYSPTYIADISYNSKVSYSASYANGQFSQMYPSQGMVTPNTVMPVYPFYHFHQSQTTGVPAHIFTPFTPSPIASFPTLIPKPNAVASNTGTHPVNFIGESDID